VTTADGLRRSVLLTVSGTVPEDLDEQIAAGTRPRADYAVLAAACDADLLDIAAARGAAGHAGRLLERIGGAGLLLAWVCFRHRRNYEVIFTDGEQVGLPLAGLCRILGRRGMRHVMIVHILSVRKKSVLVRLLRLTSVVDRFVVYSSAQRDHLVHELGAKPEQVELTSFMVDTTFFAPTAVDAERRRMVCSAGLERRDYQTLMKAVDGLDVEVVIAAASPWSKWADSSAGAEPPANVEVRRLGFVDLRRLYAESAFVVMPLADVDFQAGITTILEAMAMERAVICTRTPGQTDTIVDGVTGLYVSPGDSDALRHAIVDLLDHPERAREMGEAGRRWVREHADIEVYAARLGTTVSTTRAGSG
jgi:glycosyltransferase involved in cell wall biosynthesis